VGHLTSSGGAHRSRARQCRRLVLVLSVLALASSACASSGSGRAGAGTTIATVAVDPGCPLTPTIAERVLGAGAAPTRPPLLSGMEEPSARCQYVKGGSSLQLTVFPGAQALAQLKTVLAKAQSAPDLGPGAYCNAGTGTTQAAITCIFLKGGSTYVLGLLVPKDHDGSELRDTLHTAAGTLVRAASPTTTAP